jgi:asparagine synthase (glutamine-hydrolysing)
MSGIVGIWNLDDRPVAPALLASLDSTLEHRGADLHNRWINGSAGLSCRLLRAAPESSCETQPAIGVRGTAIVFDGRLDNRAELLAHLTECPEVASDSPDSTLILAAYDRFGDRIAEHLNGDFAFGLFDPARRRLVLARDAIGVRPLYYTRTHDTFLFASEIKALLAHPDVPAVPDDGMLACLLFNGTPPDGNLTCFKGIAVLPPAHTAVVTRERTSVVRYWDFAVTEPRRGSFQDHADAFRHVFSQAVRRRLRSASPVAVSVSGGLDSSSILCVADRLHRSGDAPAPSVRGMSYLTPAGSPSDERKFLLDLERMHALSIDRMPLASIGLMDGCRDAVRHVEAPFLDHQWNITRAFYDRARTQGVRTMLTGHWADQVLFPQAYLVDLFRQFRWGEIRRHVRAYRHWMPDVSPALFRKRFWLDLVRHHIPSALIPPLRQLRARRPPAWYSSTFRARPLAHFARPPLPDSGLPTIHARSLYEEVRSPYHVHCMEWNNKVAAMHGMDVAFPFLDRDLLLLLMSLPGDMQTRNGIPKILLREGLRGILPEAIANRKWKADFSRLGNEGMERDFSRLLDCLRTEPAAFQWGYLEKQTLQRHLAGLSGRIRGAADCELTWALSDLLALELWLQVFIERRPAPDRASHTPCLAETTT